MKQLKFKNSRFEAVFCAYVCTLFIIFCMAISCGAVIGNAHYVKAWLIGFGIAFASVWLLASLAILLGKTVVITSLEIKMCRGKKVKWCLKKEEIEECIYTNLKWYEFFIPIFYNAVASSLRFRWLRNGKLSSRCYCYLSQRQINKIKATFDYPIKETNTIHKR